jgi:hypothetical protein
LRETVVSAVLKFITAKSLSELLFRLVYSYIERATNLHGLLVTQPDCRGSNFEMLTGQRPSLSSLVVRQLLVRSKPGPHVISIALNCLQSMYDAHKIAGLSELIGMNQRCTCTRYAVYPSDSCSFHIQVYVTCWAKVRLPKIGAV